MFGDFKKLSVQFNYMLIDYILMQSDAVVINGSVAVMDMSEMKMAIATIMQPSVMKKVSVCSEACKINENCICMLFISF